MIGRMDQQLRVNNQMIEYMEDRGGLGESSGSS